MFFLTLSNLWSVAIFLPLTYVTFLSMCILYLMPSFYLGLLNLGSSHRSSFYFISGGKIVYFLTAPLMAFLITLSFWSSHFLSVWFGHIIFSCYQYKFIFLAYATLACLLCLYTTCTYITSREIYDFFSTQLGFTYWIVLLFHSNSVFASLFIVEVLSTLVFLLIVTSTFSSCFFYRNLDFSHYSFFENSTPFTFLQSLLFFFWVSLISSLNLFFFLIFLYTKLFTFDWFITEHIFLFLISISSYRGIYSFALTWFIFLFTIFIKCGIVPFFLWKPTFFKGVPLSFLIFYVTYFYYFLFLFLINFLSVYFHEVFFFYSFILVFFTTLGIWALLFIVCETFFIKTFLAVSSTLNSLLVILSMASFHYCDLIYFI